MSELSPVAISLPTSFHKGRKCVGTPCALCEQNAYHWALREHRRKQLGLTVEQAEQITPYKGPKVAITTPTPNAVVNGQAPASTPNPQQLEQMKRMARKPVGVLCKHYGAKLGTVGCKSCGGVGELHQCAIHGQCTVPQANDPSIMSCMRCEQGEFKPVAQKSIQANASRKPQRPAPTVIPPNKVKVRNAPTMPARQPHVPKKVPLRLQRVPWVVGVTTVWHNGLVECADRRDKYLPQTLRSLRIAGFDALRLFVDGCPTHMTAYYEQTFGLPVTPRWPAVKTVGNWTLSMWELYLRNPNGLRYAMFQDDCTVVKNLRTYLDHYEFPANAYWNLFSFHNNEPVLKGKEVGWLEAAPANERDHTYYHGKPAQGGKGAVALVFSREALLTLFSAPSFVNKVLHPTTGNVRVDGAIVTAMNIAGYRELIHNPSLVQHQGHEQSSMGNSGNGQAYTYPGDEFDALSFIPPEQKAV